MKYHLPIYDENSKKQKSRHSSNNVRNQEHQKEKGIIYDPIIDLNMSLYKKRGSLVPLHRDIEDYDYKVINSLEDQKSDVLIVKDKQKSSSQKKKAEHSPQDLESLEEFDYDKKKPTFATKLEKIIDSNYVVIFMAIMTLFILFSNDVQYAWLPDTVDFPFDIIQTIMLGLFTIEIIITCIAKEGYIWSFFFWLDIVATISLIQDISFIFDPIINSGSTSTPIYDMNINSTAYKNQKSVQATNAISKVSSASRY